MKPDAQLLAAQARAEAARIRLANSVDDAKARLDPRIFAEGALTSARARASDLAEDGIEAVRERPTIAAAVAAGAGLLLVRRPLGRLLGRMWRGKDKAVAADIHYT